MKFAHTPLSYITKKEFEKISKYETRDITSQNFKYPSRWKELADILLFHPNPITRHEACFVAADLQILIAHRLISVVKFDTSIVNKHEAAESLGKIKNRDDAWMAYSFLKKTTDSKMRKYDDDIYHPDVQATICESLIELEKRFPYFERGYNL